MKSKFTNFLILPTLTLSFGILAAVLLPNRGKIAVLIGSTTGSIIGAYSQHLKSEKNEDSCINASNLSPEKRLVILREQVTIFQNHLQQLSQDLNGHSSVVTASSSPQTAVNQIHQISEDQEVITWLTQQGIKVQNYHKSDENEEVFNKLASYLGNKHSELRYFYKQLKRSFSKGENLALNLNSRSKQEITCTTQFCNRMSDYAFLTSYQYDRKKKMLYASPQRTGIVINFITGGWFERFIYLSLCQLLKEHEQPYKSILNPQIILQDGEDFELDILFLIQENPFWIECKTGDYQNHVTKYSKMRTVLSIPKECSLLVILGISDQLTEELTNLHNIYIANENNFLEKAKTLIIPSNRF